MPNPLKPYHPIQDITLIISQLKAFYFPTTLPVEDLYTRLNQARDWFNANVQGFTLILEDVWNEPTVGQTTLDYQLRSHTTKDESPPLACDVYLNRQDAKGVWHLEAYQQSRLWVDEDLTTVENFLRNNTPPQKGVSV